MNKEIALRKLKELEGHDLRKIADEYGITVFKEGKPNKGWAGQTIERAIGLPLNSSQRPNAGSWELKLVSLKRKADGTIKPKETMQITMINAQDVLNRPFEISHLLAKLKSLVICGRIFVSKDEPESILYKVGTFDLEGELYEAVKRDYEEVRETLHTQGFQALTGHMGKLVQPRTKGPGHGSISRAFYARTGFVAIILDLTS